MIFNVYNSCDDLMATIDAETVEMGNNNGVCINKNVDVNFQDEVVTISPEIEKFTDSICIDIGDEIYQNVLEALLERGAKVDVAEEIASSIYGSCVDVEFSVNYENRLVTIDSVQEG